jgi:hypothetical protein
MEMYRFLKTAVLTIVLAGLLVGISGCRAHERRKVIIREEQREGEVTDVAPGEMIVE